MSAPALVALAHGSRDPRSSRTIEALVIQAPPRDRDVEAAKARARAAVRYG